VRNLQFAKVAVAGVGARANAATGIFLKPAADTLAKEVLTQKTIPSNGLR
jgi:hypothetical protein